MVAPIGQKKIKRKTGSVNYLELNFNLALKKINTG
jgi:hypothetical protein